MSERNPNGWIQTYTGKKFWPLEPRADEVDVVDIAHALSLKCRYGGHCRRFYSVAQHSVLLAWHVRGLWSGAPDHPELGRKFLTALLHDAAEAYLPDVTRPVKAQLPGFQEIEDRLLGVILSKWGLPEQLPDLIHRLDTELLVTEREQLMGAVVHEWDAARGVKPWTTGVYEWDAGVSESQYLSAFCKAVGVINGLGTF